MIFNKTLTTKLSFIFIVMFSVFGCQPETEVETIGVILPLTGQLASYGKPMLRGMEIAIEDIKEHSKENFDFDIQDSQGDPKIAVTALQRLLNGKNAKFIIGDISSSATLAMLPVVESQDAFLLSPGASSPKLSNISKSFARNYPSSLEESVASANFVFQELGITEAMIVHSNDEYGLGLKSEFERQFKSLGGTIESVEAYPTGQTEFRTMVQKLSLLKPKAIYLAGNQVEMGRFMKQYGELKLDAKIVSNISFLEPDCLNVAGDAANGVVVPMPYYDPEDEKGSAGITLFKSQYLAKHSENPTLAEAVGYDAIMLVYRAIQSVGAEPDKVAEKIRNQTNYNGALGVLNFRDGDVSIPVVFKTVQDGQVVNWSNLSERRFTR